MTPGPSLIDTEAGLDEVRPLFEAMYAHILEVTGQDLLAEDGFGAWAAGYGRAVGVARAVIVARDAQGRAVGFAEGLIRLPPAHQRPERIGHVAHLHVAPQARRSGLGRALHAALSDWFETRRARTQTIEVVVGNRAAEAFWAGLGFEPLHVTSRRAAPAAPEDQP